MIAGGTLHCNKIIGSRVSGVLLALALVIASAAGRPRVAFGGAPLDDVELLSSVMWQPIANGAKYIYPPGIPAVLRQHEPNRTLRIEEYFNVAVNGNSLVPHVRGTWAARPITN